MYCVRLQLPSFCQQLSFKLKPQTFQTSKIIFDAKEEISKATRAQYVGKGCDPVFSRPVPFLSRVQPQTITRNLIRVPDWHTLYI